MIDTLQVAGNQVVDFACGIGAALGKFADFFGYHSEAAAMLPSACGFHRSIQRQNIGLEGDGVDGRDDASNFLRAFVEIVHSGDHLVNRFAPCVAVVDALEASWLACSELSALSLTVLFSCSIAEAVSASALACCSVRDDRSLLPSAICSLLLATASADAYLGNDTL